MRQLKDSEIPLSDTTVALIEQCLDQLFTEDGLATATLSAYRFDLIGLAKAAGTTSLLALSPQQAEDFIAAQIQCLNRRSVARMLSSIQRFYRWALREEQIAHNPFADIKLPKITAKLPKTLSRKQITALLSAPDPFDPFEQRDGAMLELMYACGLRVSELVGLQLNDVLWNAGAVRCVGKGNKQRMVPMAEQSQRRLEQYVAQGRMEFAHARHSSFVFLSKKAQSMSRQGFWQRIKVYAQRAGLPSDVSPHGLRHAFATHLVDNDADLRVVQMLLGHSSLSTTQIYTQVAKTRLKLIHQTHHPRG